MADTILKTRISLKYDTLENWQGSELLLNKGEIAIAEIPTANPEAKQHPPVMFKVGIGGKKFSELDWASGLAADVYSWAKAATRPAYKYGDADLTGFGTAAEKNVGDFDAAGAASTAEENAKAYVDEKIAAIPTQAEFTLETGETDGSLVLKKNGETVGDSAVVKGWADLLAKAQKGIDDAAAAKAAAKAAQDTIDSYKTSNDKALADVKATADAAQTSAQVDTKISAHNTSSTAHDDIRQEIQGLSEKLSGRTTNYVYKNKEDTAYKAAIAKAGSFIVGDTIYFEDDNISDQWVVAVNAASPFYTFKDIETEHPSFDGYVKGTGLTSDKLVLGASGSNVKASTYGVAGALTASDEINLPTSKAVADYVGTAIASKQDKIKAGTHVTLGTDGVTVNAAWPTASDVGYGGIDKVGTVTGVKMNGVAKTVGTDGVVDLGTVITDISGKQDSLTVDQLAAVNSGITKAKVNAYDGYATSKQDTISATNRLSADLVSGLGAAAKKGVASSVTAAGTNLPTEKAVADYVDTKIGGIDIPTVSNAALKDASGATIFTANASADVEITIIDCGNASGWDA